MTKEEWSEKVKQTLKERDMSVQKLAFIIGRSDEYIYRQISGRKLSQKGVNEISNFLGIESIEVAK